MDRPAALIEEWFRDHDDDDGDFLRHNQRCPFQIVSPCDGATRIVYVTKASIAMAANAPLSPACKLGVVAGYGLPSEADVDWIRDFAAGREVMFLGDMDPADLMIFAWLRARLHPLRVTHLGVSDTYMEELNACIPRSYQIALATSEIASLATLKTVLPDMEAVIGTGCSRILDQGHKIELEAIVSALGSANAILRPAQH